MAIPVCQLNHQQVSFKDHFSDAPDNYRQFRPHYPDTLFEWLAHISPSREQAWDCATGNGQAALALARYFNQVIATDGSEQQINAAMPVENVRYQVARETCDIIHAHSTDLITVAQALHWFDTDTFFREVARVLRPGGLLAVWGYNLLQVNPQIDAFISQLYYQTVGAYWPPERQLLEGGYSDIGFPWPAVTTPEFSMRASWQRRQLIGYLGTWSAVKRYQEDTAQDPLTTLDLQLLDYWPDDCVQQVRWPLTLKVCRKPCV